MRMRIRSRRQSLSLRFSRALYVTRRPCLQPTLCRSSIELRTNDAFEPRLVFDDHCRSFYLQELLFLEIGEETRHGLS
jgi:hypothetical protein